MFKVCPLSFLISQSSNFVMSGVKNLVVMKHNLPITKIVEDIMEQIFHDDYKYLDPKIIRIKTPFSDQIVFGVGGGNYFEYQNLQDYVMSKNVGYSSIGGKFVMEKMVVDGSNCNICSVPGSLETLRRVVYEQCGPIPLGENLVDDDVGFFLLDTPYSIYYYYL